MDYIKSWTFCICITLIVSVIFSILSPKGTMGKFYKVIISVFIFISFLYPLTDFSFDEFKMDFNFNTEYENLVESSAKQEIEYSVGKVLTDNEIYNSSISAEVEQNGDEVLINRILVSVTDDYSVEDVKALLFENLGVVAEVKRIGE
ncbi:MAG: stage III sporulation protein AF [Eubacterium sp.]|nr:stage III sporulation protein AF [Eubacterium sp.]